MSDIFGSKPGPMTGGKLTRSQAETDANAAKYARDMKPYFDAKLLADRSDIVIDLRADKRSGTIDSKYDRWYRAADWTDAGVYTGDPGWFDTLHPDASVTETPRTVTKTPGRPKSDAALSGADRAKAFRDRKKGETHGAA